MKIYTSQNVLLTKDNAITPPEGFSLDGYTNVYTQDDWITVPIVDGADMDVIIHADQVLIYRRPVPARSQPDYRGARCLGLPLRSRLQHPASHRRQRQER